jgi:hypothetical protein
MSAVAIINFSPVAISLMIRAFPINRVFLNEILVIPTEFAFNEHVENTTNWRGVPA